MLILALFSSETSCSITSSNLPAIKILKSSSPNSLSFTCLLSSFSCVYFTTNLISESFGFTHFPLTNFLRLSSLCVLLCWVFVPSFPSVLDRHCFIVSRTLNALLPVASCDSIALCLFTCSACALSPVKASNSAFAISLLLLCSCLLHANLSIISKISPASFLFGLFRLLFTALTGGSSPTTS